jgi:hypothetical protein
MKTIFIQIMILFLCGIATLQAQELITIEHSCSFEDEETNREFYYFGASSEADQIVEQIVDAVSLSKNFVVKSSDCKNALATVSGGKRFILYNTSFLEKFKKDARTKWAAYCVLAHEIGHHLNGHDFETKDSKLRKQMELQADIFAGGVLHKMGATLDEAKAGIELLQNQEGSETHPPARARSEAIANGWKKSEENSRRLEREQSNTTATPAEKKVKEEVGLTPPDELFSKETKTHNEPAPNLTAVSDQLLMSSLMGSWNITLGYNAYGHYVVVQNTFFADGSMLGQTYLNGIISESVTSSWTISNNQLVNLEQNGHYYYYSISFNGSDYLALTYTGGTGPSVLAVGTILYYTRAK